MYLRKMLQRTIRMLAQVELKAVLLMCLAHFTLSYCFLFLANEPVTKEFVQFFYFYVVTASTVGYGDASPETIAGKLVVSLFFIPFSLALFAMLLARFGELVAKHLRKEIMGEYSFEEERDQILLMGYHEQRTHEQVNLILSDPKRKPRKIIVVTDNKEIQHPFLDIDGVEFCRVDSLIDDNSLSRVSLTEAAKIMVEGTDDNARYVLSSHYASINKTAHITTHIKSGVLSNNLQAQFDNIEVVEDNTDELMVRAMQDCGSSRAISQLLKASEGQTFYVTELCFNHAISVKNLKRIVAEQQGILFGLAFDSFGKTLQLNPGDEVKTFPGKPFYIHYVAESRLPSNRFTHL